MSDRKVAMAVVAHPDDIEFAMAGTLILLGRRGFEPHYMTIANGSCGSVTMDRDRTVAARTAEAADAAALKARTHSAANRESLIGPSAVSDAKPQVCLPGACRRMPEVGGVSGAFEPHAASPRTPAGMQAGGPE